MYFAASSGQIRKITNAKTRRHIWCNDKNMKYEDIGVYQPEDDGYEVLSIDQGKLFILVMIMHAHPFYRFHATSFIRKRCLFQLHGICN